MDVVKRIAALECDEEETEKPKQSVVVADCGVVE